jgi:hypothetical protein
MNTTIEIEEPKIKELEKLTYNPTVKNPPSADTKTKIMRIEMEEDFTRIDFVTVAGKYAWVEIEGNTFIRPVGTKMRLGLIKAQGIPMAPKRYYFKNPKESLYYTLYFPALPKSVREIDIIEREAAHSGSMYFNFYGVSMERVRKEVILVGS